MRLHCALFALATTASLGVACSSDDDDNGTLQQTWTIAGSTDPGACARVGASQMRVVVLDPALFVQATQFAACSDFATAISLDNNTYTASATFLDANGVAVSETRTLTIFSIFEGQTTTLSIDFPLASFFPR